MSNARGRMPTKNHYDRVKTQNPDGSPTATVLAEYELSDYDADSNPIYTGNVNPNGAWYIASYNTTTGATRYVRGLSAYSTAWTNRAAQSYGYFDATF